MLKWSRRRLVARLVRLLVVVLLPATGCADPYERYADVVHEDVDAALLAALRMTARVQLTVVHNQIPDDSLSVVVDAASGAAREAWNRARHFAAVTPPPDLAELHANLSAELFNLAHALDAMGATLRRCADSRDSSGKACQAHLAELAARFGFVGEDLNMARSRVQRALLPHGVLLRRVA